MGNDLVQMKQNVQALSDSLLALDSKGIGRLVEKATDNLEALLREDSPLAADPEMAVSVFRIVKDLELKSFEAKRRLLDTLVKARNSLVDSTPDQGFSFVEDPLAGKHADDASLASSGIKKTEDM